MTGARVVWLAGAIAACAACDNGEALPDWSRMITQPKLLPYGETAMFRDGRAMRPLPPGAVARDGTADPQGGAVATLSGDLERSETGGRAPRGIDTVPVPVTRALLDRGRRRFAIACATCHGVAGDGDSPVARAMQRRRPPSLHEPRLVALGPAALYRVIAIGYGLMPSYAKLLTPDDRWAVVAYVRTLQLAWRVKLAALPPAVRDDAIRRLP
jgi:mono/diheme cytochrome c family protein